MHLSENEGIEGKTFLVTGGLGHVGSALCLELVRRGAYQVRAFDLRTNSPWSHLLINHGVHCIQGLRFLLLLFNSNSIPLLGRFCYHIFSLLFNYELYIEICDQIR